MGRKRVRKTKTSKGQRQSIVAGVKEARSSVPEIDRALGKLVAWKKGQNPWITVPGTDKNKAWVKKRANEVYGDPRYVANIYRGKNTDE